MQILPSSPLTHTGAQALASSTGANASSSSGSANITRGDFLQLLVTEMKNQDPTANSDPNQYINQLVQVNSLEQLIQINADLGGASGTSSGSGGSATPHIRAAATSEDPATAASAPPASPATTHPASRLAEALGAAASPASNFDALLQAMRPGTQPAGTIPFQKAR